MTRKTSRGGGRGSGRGRATGRDMHVSVKTARGRKASSTRWLARQLNDPYVHEARRRGYRSRAAFKLLQLAEKYDLLRRGQRVVDLGAAPGGWTQVAVDLVRPAEAGGAVVAIDVLEMDPVTDATVLRLDIRDAGAPARLIEALGGRADVVMSDMAAPVTGHRATDHLRTMALCEEAFAFACEALAPGGTFIVKAFAGGAQAELMARINKRFDKVRTVKPDASRSESPETYIVATGFRAAPAKD